MAKNTFSSAFRKIDVDQYNEDNFEEDEIDSGTTAVGPDENEITKLLTQYPLQYISFTHNLSQFVQFSLTEMFTGKNVEALKLALEGAPLCSKNQQIKVWPISQTVFWLYSRG